MAVLASNQQTLVDLTDAYNVILTSESYTFPGSTTAAKAGSCTTQVIAMRGAEQIACTVGTVSTKPTGITVSSNGDATAPTLTITASTSFTTAGDVVIPVIIGDVTINKRFSVAIAFTGQTGSSGKGIKSTAVTYQSGTSATTAPTGTWASAVPSVAEGSYLWTRTVITYTDSTTSTSYSVAKQGETGATGATGKGISSTAITYQVSSSGTTVPTGTWQSNVQATTTTNKYLWTRTVITYSDSTTSTSYSVSMKGDTGATGAKGDTGATGAAGADAITMTVTSSAGFIFKNTDVATTLTAHVYKAGVELTASQIAALGTVKWYKDGSTTALTTTGATLTVAAGDVTDKASYTAQLES